MLDAPLERRFNTFHFHLRRGAAAVEEEVVVDERLEEG